jgi:acetyltransferase-like isoleucine patch superfamily enzyme
MKEHQSHGSGEIVLSAFKSLGRNVVFEPGALVFHPENITIGSNVYVGHNAILKGYYKNLMVIGDECWIGQQVFLHSAGTIRMGRCVGIGPGAVILTSQHTEPGPDRPLMEGALRLAPVEIGDGADIGARAVVLPGVRVGKGAQVGAGAVVTKDVDDYAVVAGNPARFLRSRRSPTTRDPRE